MTTKETLNNFACAVSLMSVLLVLPLVYAEASPARLVFPGKEIVVAPVRAPLSGIFQRQSVSSTTVHIPKELGLRLSAPRGDVAVVALPSSLSRQSTAPVQANEVAISRACEAILNANPDKLLRCEPNWLFSVARVPDDARYSSLYGLKKLRLPLAWDVTVGSNQVLAAVLDSGVDYTHDDLESNIPTNPGEVSSNGIDDDANGFIDDVRGFDFVDQDADPMDENGHGTHCAGIIGAKGNNGLGVVGVNWRVGLLPVRVLNTAGQGASSDIAAGIIYAVDRGASVVNLSLGGTSFSQVVEDAIQYALDRDVMVVAAAGNTGTNNDRTPVYPASSTKSNVIAVAASTGGDTLASFSNYGLESVDVAAPGDGILSTVPGNGYDVLDGTSMAAPHVTGLAALLKSLNNSRPNADIRDVILSTAVLRVGLREKISTGGRVDGAAAVQALATGLTPTPTPAPTGPTATPTPRSSSGGVSPQPTNSPGGVGSGPVTRLTLRRFPKKRSATLFGNAFDAAGVGIAGGSVSLICSGKQVGSYTTLGGGAFIFNVKRTRKAQSCQAWTPNGILSPVVRVAKR
jgi:thermitase